MRRSRHHTQKTGNHGRITDAVSISERPATAEDRDVQNGTLAQLAYIEIINPETAPEVRDREIKNLLQYCELDTQAMVGVVR